MRAGKSRMTSLLDYVTDVDSDPKFGEDINPKATKVSGNRFFMKFEGHIDKAAFRKYYNSIEFHQVEIAHENGKDGKYPHSHVFVNGIVKGSGNTLIVTTGKQLESKLAFRDGSKTIFPSHIKRVVAKEHENNIMLYLSKEDKSNEHLASGIKKKRKEPKLAAAKGSEAKGNLTTGEITRMKKNAVKEALQEVRENKNNLDEVISIGTTTPGLSGYFMLPYLKEIGKEKYLPADGLDGNIISIDLKPCFYQREAIERAEEYFDFPMADNREINFIIDAKSSGTCSKGGDGGKSHFGSMLEDRWPGRVIVVTPTGATLDSAMHAIMKRMDETGVKPNTSRIFVFDLTRSSGCHNGIFEELEMLKNGKIETSKYGSGCLKSRVPPHIIVLTNWFPHLNMYTVSEDRCGNACEVVDHKGRVVIWGPSPQALKARKGITKFEMDRKLNEKNALQKTMELYKNLLKEQKIIDEGRQREEAKEDKDYTRIVGWKKKNRQNKPKLESAEVELRVLLSRDTLRRGGLREGDEKVLRDNLALEEKKLHQIIYNFILEGMDIDYYKKYVENAGYERKYEDPRDEDMKSDNFEIVEIYKYDKMLAKRSLAYIATARKEQDDQAAQEKRGIVIEGKDESLMQLRSKKLQKASTTNKQKEIVRSTEGGEDEIESEDIINNLMASLLKKNDNDLKPVNDGHPSITAKAVAEELNRLHGDIPLITTVGSSSLLQSGTLASSNVSSSSTIPQKMVFQSSEIALSPPTRLSPVESKNQLVYPSATTIPSQPRLVTTNEVSPLSRFEVPVISPPTQYQFSPVQVLNRSYASSTSIPIIEAESEKDEKEVAAETSSLIPSSAFYQPMLHLGTSVLSEPLKKEKKPYDLTPAKLLEFKKNGGTLKQLEEDNIIDEKTKKQLEDFFSNSS